MTPCGTRWISSEGVLRFGKHVDVPISDVPIEYLLWLKQNYDPADLSQLDFMAQVEREYNARLGIPMDESPGTTDEIRQSGDLTETMSPDFINWRIR